MRLALMIEGQEGVTWEQWVALARACEDSGIEALLRSDHYSSFLGGAEGSLDAWSTVTALAAVTERVRLGTLVSPVTFRHPSLLARMAASASAISGGRVELGVGAGWNEGEHRAHGFPFPPAAERFAIFAEQVEIIRRSFGEERFDFAGVHYRLEGADPRPKPLGALNLIVGGNAKPVTVAAAVGFADEYNTGFVSVAEAARRRAVVDEACARAGREPLTFSLLAQCVVGEDRDALARRRERIAAIAPGDPFGAPEIAIEGTVDEVVARLRDYEAAGVERVMLRHLDVEDLEMVALLGREVRPAVS